MLAIILDIETAPDDQANWTELQRLRHAKETAKHVRYGRDLAEAERLAASLSPFPARVVCISVQSTDGRQPKPPKSYCGPNEKQLLAKFWADMKQAPDDCLWVTYNGKLFDCPFLAARSLKHGIQPTRQDLLQLSPFSHHPHLDLCRALFGSQHFRLVEACEFLGIRSPKQDVDGSQVAELVAAGDWARVARYCEGDVLATLLMYQRSRWHVQLFPFKRKSKGQPPRTNGQQQSQPKPYHDYS